MAGKPRVWDPAGTRQGILTAASGLFSEHGFDAVSIQQIADAAQVSKSLVHHHFGSKKDLFESVRQEKFRPYFEVQERLIENFEERPALDTMRDSVIAYFRFCQSNPDATRMMLWSCTDTSDGQPFDARGADLIRAGIESIARDQTQGRLRPDVPARMVLMMFFGLIQHWFWSKDRNARAGFVRDDEDEDDAYLHSLLAVFIDGLAPRPSTGAPS
jgi:TetR/AcrR family transcriptional regulator